jgi:hypothetical protein
VTQGDCLSPTNPVFATNSWMHRSCHTCGHLGKDFLLGTVAMTAAAIEELQGVLRQMLHQLTTGHQASKFSKH